MIPEEGWYEQKCVSCVGLWDQVLQARTGN
jgi:hypothetical protein